MLITNNLYKNFYSYSQGLQTESFLGIKNIQTSSNQIDNKEKNINKKIFNIGMSTMIGLLILLMSSKGLQKIFSDKLNKFKDFLDYHLVSSSLGEISKTKQFTNFVMRKISNFLRKFQSINNITSLKDILFKKMMYQTEFTKKIHDGISNWFENSSKKTVNKSYKKTRELFDKMYEKFDKLDEYILKNSTDEIVHYNGKDFTIQEMVDKIRKERELLKFSLEACLSEESVEKRHAIIKEINSNLCSTFWDVSFKDFGTKNHKFKRKEMWQTFIAEEQMKEGKDNFLKAFNNVKQFVAYDKNVVGDTIFKYLNELKNTLPLFDTKGYEQLRKLEWIAKQPEILQNNKELLIKELNKLEKSQKFDNIDPQAVLKLEEHKKKYVKTIKQILNDDTQSIIQEIIPIYYKIAPFELVKSGTLSAVKKAVKSFDKYAHLQTYEIFDKVRDLELGSAPTDILTIVLSSILVTYELLKAKDKNETRTVILTSGIPLAGAIATTMIATTKLISGGKSLALGAVSGLVLNIIGKKLSNLNIFKQNKKTTEENNNRNLVL